MFAYMFSQGLVYTCSQRPLPAQPGHSFTPQHRSSLGSKRSFAALPLGQNVLDGGFADKADLQISRSELGKRTNLAVRLR